MTPESLPRPPRRVRGKLGGTLWFGRIFMLPHTLVGIGAAGYLIFLLLWRLVGADVPATVTGTEISHSSKSGDSYLLKFQYQVDGEKHSGTGSVSRAVYDQYQPGNGTNPPVTVHYFSLGPLNHAALCGYHSLWTEVGFLALWTGFWDLVVGIFVYQLWILPWRRRWLYRRGEVTAGTVLRKWVRTGKSSTYYIAYSFKDPFSGQPIESTMVVWNAADWNQAVEGQSVVVLYHSTRPKRNTVYEFGGYRVVSDNPMYAL